MTNQSTSHVIMIEPKAFLANPQTLSTNAHQLVDDTPMDEIQANAKQEHQVLVEKLISLDVTVQVFSGQEESPDDLFCNNWISFHEQKPFVLYPMYARNRRLERRADLCEIFEKEYGKPIDFSHYETDNLFLESTGSMVLDRIYRRAYAALSPRTTQSLFLKWCETLDYEPLSFSWHYSDQSLVYHTNVIMFIGSTVAGICSQGLFAGDKDLILSKLSQDREIIDLSYEQIASFSGNALELRNHQDDLLLVMSTSAYQALEEKQLKRLETHYKQIVHSDISTIEKYGGGSVRCLLLEKF